MCEWTDVQKVIYAKRLLRGSAKVFVNFEIKASSWKKFKRNLIDEFSSTLNSKQVHQTLSHMRKKPNETYQAYIYRALKVASHADMEIESKIQYIIDGVPDDEANKSVLYGATTIKELRKRFQHYETQKSHSVKTKPLKNQAADKHKRTGQAELTEKTKRCFNCGSKSHLSKDCPDKEKGSKCFNLLRQFWSCSIKLRKQGCL